jgi:hypothetical protein
MQRSLDVLHMFPSLGAAGRRFASLPRVLRGEFPCFHGTIKALRLPAAHPAALRCLRWAIPPRSLVRFAPRRTSAPSRPGVGHPVTPAGMSRRRRQDLPSSWGTPIVRLPCSVDAGRTAGTRPVKCRSVAPGSKKNGFHAGHPAELAVRRDGFRARPNKGGYDGSIRRRRARRDQAVAAAERPVGCPWAGDMRYVYTSCATAVAGLRNGCWKLAWQGTV